MQIANYQAVAPFLYFSFLALFRVKCTGDGNRTRTSVSAHRIFVPATTFVASKSDLNRDGICGLDFLFTIAQFTLSRRYRLLSLYTFPDSENIRNGTWLGIAIVQKVSPNLSDSTPNVSAWALKLLLSPACLPVPPPRRVV